MNSKDLSRKWSEISPSSNARGFRLLRITATCLPELSIGLDFNARRCLVLSVQPSVKVQLRDFQRENISLEYLPDDKVNYVSLKLSDSFFSDLFDDLVVSIYHSIAEITNEADQAKALIRAFHKWSEFFDRGNSGRLTREDIQGLMGELKVLQTLVESGPEQQVNSLLGAWRGPYGRSADFILDDKDLEVKTVAVGKKAIRISSEHQLDPQPGKGLELVVVEVVLNPQHGISLSAQVNELKEVVFEKLGDFSIVLTALKQKGISAGNIIEYDNFRFVYKSSATYDTCADTFPKLTSATTPTAVCEIDYTLRLSLLSEFSVETVDYTIEGVQ